MSQLPPGHFTDFTQPQAPQNQRVSLLAISSLVLSFICCIPGLSAVGAGLGVAGLLVIGRAAGRLTGMGLAVAGIVIGLLISVLQLGLVIGLAMGAQSFQPYGTTLAAINAGDIQESRRMFSVELDRAVTEEHLGQFKDEFQAQWGEFQQIPLGLADLASGYLSLGSPSADIQTALGKYPDDPIIPLPAEFDQGMVLVLVILDPSQIRSNMPSIRNLGVVDKKGQIIWLIDPDAF